MKTEEMAQKISKEIEFKKAPTFPEPEMPKRIKKGYFNVTRGGGTKPGKLFTTRIITPDHSIYSQYFNPDGTRKEQDKKVK